MALHTFANELFCLLGHHASDESALMVLLEQEFKRLYSDQVSFKWEALMFLIHHEKSPLLEVFFLFRVFRFRRVWKISYLVFLQVNSSRQRPRLISSCINESLWWVLGIPIRGGNKEVVQ